MNDIEDELSGCEKYAEDADELIRKLDSAPPIEPEVAGSKRYKRLWSAYERLKWTGDQFAGDNRKRWDETTTTSGRIGAYLMQEIDRFLKALRNLGENKS